MRYVALALLTMALVALAVTTHAQNGMVGGIGAGDYAGGLGGGISFGVISGTVGSAPAPPVGCTGVVDLTTGCVLPMLGGL